MLNRYPLWKYILVVVVAIVGTIYALPNLYGRSKKAGEELLYQYQRETNARVYVFRFPYVFGKWSKPNANNAPKNNKNEPEHSGNFAWTAW